MKFSIITVNYNCNRYLYKAIISVLGQKYQDIEYVIIDGGSTDGSIDTITDAASRDERVRWISEPDMGIADAMNKGISLATGDIIGILHADDYFSDNDVLDVVAAAFANAPETKWVTGGTCLVNDVGDLIQRIGVRRYSFRRLLRSNIIIHPSTFVIRQTLQAAGGFNIALRYAMDYDLWLRLGTISMPTIIDTCLSCFRIHDGSLSTKYADSAFVEEQQIRIDYLKSTGHMLWPHNLFYMVKRPINHMFCSRLRKRSSRIR